MSRPTFEVADVLRRHGDAYASANAGHLDRSALRVMGAVEVCRTATLGGHVARCGDCGHTAIAYNSCRNRHCPKCQAGAARDWLEARQDDLLPVEYFHVVFTLPAQIAAIAYQNKAVVYALLFEAASQTLKTIGADPKHLGAEIGATMVLHTWGQTLTHHPHVHCIVPGGGVSLDGRTWIACRPGFFLPVRVLSRLYRRLFLEKLIAAHRAGKLHFFNALAGLADTRAFASHIAPLRRIDWIVYAKRPFAGPEQVLAYLSRYTHRIAISNRRIVGLDDTHVAFTWRDYAHGSAAKIMRLDAHEFIRRFLLHVLPDGFQRIRHYGFLANGHRKAKLAVIRRCLALPEASNQALPEASNQALPEASNQALPEASNQALPEASNQDVQAPVAPDQPDAATPTEPARVPCPCCGGTMEIIEVLADPRRRRFARPMLHRPTLQKNDTS